MTELTEHASPPPRTWRPMAAWTGAILLVLALAWFVTAAVVPAFGTDRILRELDYHHTNESTPWPTWDRSAEDEALKLLGGPEKVFARLKIYRALPSRFASHRPAALRLLGLCGTGALPLIRETLASPDGAEVVLALGILHDKFLWHDDLAALAPGLTRLLDEDRVEEPWPAVPLLASRIIAWTGPANPVFRAEGESAQIHDSKLVRVETAAGLVPYSLGSLQSAEGVKEYQRTVGGGKALHFDSVSGVLRGNPLARIGFSVPETGSYYVFLRGDAWCCGCQILEFRIDDGPTLIARDLWLDCLDWQSLIQGRLIKDRHGIDGLRPEPIKLAAGEHSLTITGAEPICGGMIIDELAVVRSRRAAAEDVLEKIRGKEPSK